MPSKSSKFKLGWETLRQGFAEFSASTMLLCLGCIGCIDSYDFPNSQMQTGLNFGLVVLSCIQCFHCISGAHINPCISIAAIIVGEVPWQLGLIYILCQFLGAFCGYGIALSIAPGFAPDYDYFCTTVPIFFISNYVALGFEYVLTATWVFAMCAVWDHRNAANRDSLSVRIGLVVSCLTISGGYFTGGSMNPARSLAPAVFKKFYKQLWIYFIAPPLAAVTISLAWRFLYACENKQLQSSDNFHNV